MSERIDYKQASIETAHEAALVEHLLRKDADDLWAQYYAGIADTDCHADMVHDYPRLASEKRVTADKASKAILEAEILAR